MVRYLSWLVASGIFQKVYLHFLPVGCVAYCFDKRTVSFASMLSLTLWLVRCVPCVECDTRTSDVDQSTCTIISRHTKFGPDQIFSRHSVHLQRRNVTTINQLVNELVESYTVPGLGKPVVRMLEEVADVRMWLEPHSDKAITDVTGGYETHEFLFERRARNGECNCFVSTKPYCFFDEYVDAGFALTVRP